MSTQVAVGTFTRMDDATPEELAVVVSEAQHPSRLKVADRMLELLETLKGPTLGYQVDRYEHSLQTATPCPARRRPHRHGRRRALLHDVGDAVAPANHSELAATIISPYVDAETTWVVRHHGVFQGYHYWHKIGFDRNARDRYRDSPYFDAAAHFCAEWDQQAFDPDYDTLPIEYFEPMRARGVRPPGERLRRRVIMATAHDTAR